MKNCPRCGALIPDGPEHCEPCRRKAAGEEASPGAPALAPAPPPPPAARPPGRSLGLVLRLTVAALCVFALYRGCAFIATEFNELGRHENEEKTRGNLGAIRSALSIYYGDMEGAYPEDLASLTKDNKYLSHIARVTTFSHGDVGDIVFYGAVESLDTGGWGYVNNPYHADFGTLFVDCTHTDVEGSVWTTY